MLRATSGAAIVFVALGALAPAADIALRLPLACEVGKTCFVQNYVDNDPSPAARDYTCGTQTYDAHNGIDFRLPTMERMKEGVAVLAAADGRVLRVRDGVADVSVRDIGLKALRGQECGNGVVVAHAGGFETQYCHMRQGSIAVKPGDSIKAGDQVGRVGLSGNTEYAHLHFTLRHAGKVADPFAYGAPDGTCGGGAPLWEEPLRTALAYRPGGAILNQGFAGKPVTMEEIDSGDAARALASTDAPALVAYVRAIGLRQGDVLRLAVRGPDGEPFADSTAAPLDHDKAQYFLMTGRKRPPQGWKAGSYRATFSVQRSGTAVLEQSFEIRL